MFKKSISIFIMLLMIINLGIVFNLDAVAAEDELDKTIWTATAIASLNTALPNLAVDGNSYTHLSGDGVGELRSWRLGRNQAVNDWFKLDMGKDNKVTKLTLKTITGYHAQTFDVFYSTDNLNYQTAVSNVSGDTGTVTTVTFAEITARYIRIQLKAAVSRDWIIAEINAYGTELTPLNLGQITKEGWIATSSGNGNANYTPDKAIDGYISSHTLSGGSLWQCAPNLAQNPGSWFKINMGKKNKISRLLMSSMVAANSSPSSFKVEVSNDDSSYTQVATGAGDADKINYNTFVTFNEVEAQYVKVTLTGTANYSWYMSEAHLYGPITSTPPPIPTGVVYSYGSLANNGWGVAARRADNTNIGTTPANAIDKSITTGWDSGSETQKAGFYFKVALDKINVIDKIGFYSDDPTKHAGKYKICVSTTDPNDAPATAVSGVIGDPSNNFNVVEFPPVKARYIYIILEEDYNASWKMNELYIYNNKINKDENVVVTASSGDVGIVTDGDYTENTFTTDNFISFNLNDYSKIDSILLYHTTGANYNITPYTSLDGIDWAPLQMITTAASGITEIILTNIKTNYLKLDNSGNGEISFKEIDFIGHSLTKWEDLSLSSALWTKTFSAGENQKKDNYYKVSMDKNYFIDKLILRANRPKYNALKFKVEAATTDDVNLYTTIVDSYSSNMNSEYNIVPFNQTVKLKYLKIVLLEDYDQIWEISDLFAFEAHSISESKFYIDTQQITSLQSGTVKVSKNMKSNSPTNALFVVGLFKKDTKEMVKVVQTTVSIGIVEKEYSAEIQVPIYDDMSKYELRVFVWKGINELILMSNGVDKL